jgi:hypothetical protein
MRVKIPTKVLDEIQSYIEIDSRLSNSNEKEQQKLIKILIELWLLIYNKQIDDKDLLNLKGYVNINKNDFKSFNIQISGLRYYYRDLLEMLMFSGLISINDKYSNNSFYKGYRIETTSIKTDYLSEIEIDFDKVCCNNNKSFWLNKYKKQSNLIEDAYNTTINLDEYISWINNNIGIELKPILKNGRLTKRFLTEERGYHHIFLALKLNMKNIWFKLSDEGRFYSSISNLPSGSVPFIRLYGCKTINLDIKNCQPLLLSTIINNKQFSSDTQEGLFYDKMASELNMDRNEFKVLSYKYIFFGSNELKSGKIYDCMEKLYKGIMVEINNIKREGCLAKKLQKIESDIFVKSIGKIKMHKCLRHDEVIVMENNKELMVKCLRREFNLFNIILF